MSRKAVPSLVFNGKNVTKHLEPYLESISYMDVAEGSSDTMDIKLQNIGMKWMGPWYPKKGDKVKGSVTFLDWEKEGSSWTYDFGQCILDEMSFSGNPRSASFGCLAVPAKESFQTRERTKTWKDVTLQKIGEDIAKKYGLKCRYNAPSIRISSIEQSQESDSSFLYKTCEDYGLAMKVFNSRIIIYDMARLEAKAAVMTMTGDSFVDGAWDYKDVLAGTYTGARVSYKGTDSSDEISVFLGLVAEEAKGSRVLKVNETCDSEAEARRKGAAQVNKSNREATTISGTILANRKMYAGITVNIKGLGMADGKYFVDKVTTEVSGSGTTQQVEMHKCQKILEP